MQQDKTEIEISFCVVNTQQRELLLRGLDAIARERATLPFATEVLVLDNRSLDGSAGAAKAHPAVDRVIRRERRYGKSENDTHLLQKARGRYCLLLNEDSELHLGATAELHKVLESNPRAAAAGAALLRPDGTPQPCAWRFPTPLTAAFQALFLHNMLVVQSKGTRPRQVDWAQSAALLVRREAAAEVGYLDAGFFVYSDEVDFCKRLHKHGWTVHHVPQARAFHHEQLATGPAPQRRIIELSRNRDRYMRKHHTPGAARAVRWFTAWAYAVRTLAAFVLPGHDPQRYAKHVTATLFPERGDGLRESAAEFNRGTRL